MPPAADVALALSVTLLPTVKTEPAAGAVTDTVAVAAAATVTLTAAEVTVAPLESVTRAVNETAPVPEGVQFTE